MRRVTFMLCVLGVLAAASFGLSACNTVEGFGQDLQRAGQGIQKTAQ